MAWDKRGYLYRSERRDGRVVRVYCGRGTGAEALAALWEGTRAMRQAQAAEQRRTATELDLVAAQVSAYSGEVDRTTRAAITAAGYHRHKRGPWHKRRKQMQQDQNGGIDLTVVSARSGGLVPAVPSVPFDKTTGGRLLKMFGERLADKDDAAAQERIRQEYLQVRAGAAGPCPSPLEELLAERIAVCYLHVQYAERIYQAVCICDMPGKMHTIYLARIDQAQARYLAAIKALAQVRRLNLPIVNMAFLGASQVSVGGQQVNASAG
jgi:hypothetical protein